MARVLLVSGGWGQNIGNAFFNLGGQYVLEAAGHTVRFARDSSAYWTFRNQSKGAYPNAFDLLTYLDADLVVLQGPLFTVNFPTIWLEQLQALRARGTRWAVLSGAFRTYSRDEHRAADVVLRAVPPDFIITRDRDSAELLNRYGHDAHVGIDSAFFVPKVAAAAQHRKDEDRIVTLVFDRFSEPDIVPDPAGVVRLDDRSYALNYGRIGEIVARLGKAWAYLYAPLGGRTGPTHLGRHLIVRPSHRTNPHVPMKIYRHPNAIASDEPWSYLALYSTTDLTISDRVHACVATLAYGRPAMFHNPSTERARLFSAIGAGAISQHPVSIDVGRLTALQDDVIEAVRARSA